MASKTSLVGLVLTGALGLGGHTSHAQRVDQRNVWVLNNTNREISQLYVSPHESERWGQDVLGQVTLPHGLGTVVSFDSRSATSCVMDFRRPQRVSDSGGPVQRSHLDWVAVERARHRTMRVGRAGRTTVCARAIEMGGTRRRGTLRV